MQRRKPLHQNVRMRIFLCQSLDLMPSIQNVKAVEINLFHRTNWNFSWRFDIMVSFQDENLSQTDNHAGLMTGDWAMRVWPHSLIGSWGLGAFSVFWGISWSSLELNEVTILQEAMWCYRSFTFFLWRKLFLPHGFRNQQFLCTMYKLW